MSNILLRVRDITKKYPRGKNLVQVLKGVSFDLYKGEIFSLLGANGAGKTTLSSIIATIYPPDSGDIERDGVSIYKNLIEHRRRIGFCPQAPNIDISLSLKKNLYFSGKYYGLSNKKIEERIAYVLNRFGLVEYANEKAQILSGGYQRRFLLARTLLHQPSLVILDEPTVGLDPHVRRDLWNMMRSLKQDGVTILLTTHYFDEAEMLSDRVCIIDCGVIRLINTFEHIKKMYVGQNLEEIFIELVGKVDLNMSKS